MKNADRLWVWLTQYRDGSVGTVGALIPGLGTTPLVSRDEQFARERLGPLAMSHATKSGQRVWLRCYHGFTDEQDLTP